MFFDLRGRDIRVSAIGIDSRRRFDPTVNLLMDTIVFLFVLFALWFALRSSGIGQMLAVLAMAAMLILRHRKSLTHPLVWFVPVFALYTLAYPGLAVIGLYDYNENLQKAVGLHAIALFSLSIALYGRVVNVPDVFLRSRWPDSVTRQHWSIAALLPLMMVATAGVYLITLGGADSKQDLVATDSPILGITLLCLNLALLLFSVIVVSKAQQGASWVMWVAMAAIVSAMVVLNLGERDYLLRVIIISVLVCWDFSRRPTFITIVLIGVVGVVSLPLLQQLKVAGSNISGVSIQLEAASIFGQEFRVMTQNTYQVIALDLKSLSSGVDPLFRDIKRIFSSSLLGFEAVSTGKWYNEDILYSVQTGRGFSLVAWGYLVGGSLGVFVTYLLLGLIVGHLYESRTRSLWNYAVFVSSAPLLLYAQRADFANLVSPILKSIVIPLAFFWALSKLPMSAAGQPSLRPRV